MPKKYFIYLPLVQGSIEEEWEQCLNQIEKTRLAGNRPLKLNIFVDLTDFPTFLKVKGKIGQSVIAKFGDQCPAYNVTIHPPERPWKVTVEGLFITGSTSAISTKFSESIPYVIIGSKSFKEVWCAGLGNDLYPDDTKKAATVAFEQIVDILNCENLSLNNLVRQWNFIGNILTVKDGFQNYQTFNEVRSEYYHKYRTIHGYPAATGVGMKLGGVYLDFCAVTADNSLKIKAIDNPNQINPYEYGQQVLKGFIGKGNTVKHPPQFERALLLLNNEGSILYVSGTASIIGQDTIGKGDIREQTVVTIENIKKLTDIERISQLMGGINLFNGQYSLLRVYIKNQEDFGVVKEICNSHFPMVPAVFLEADICREDLLTEIEAEFVL